MTIRLNIDPATLPTAQHKGINHATGRVYTKKCVRDARKTLWWELIVATRGACDVSPDSAWSVSIRYNYRPKVFPRRLWGQPKSTRPDCDNLTKLILDVIAETRRFYLDDAQVAELEQCKYYVASPAVEPGIEIDIERCADNA